MRWFLLSGYDLLCDTQVQNDVDEDADDDQEDDDDEDVVCIFKYL